MVFENIVNLFGNVWSIISDFFILLFVIAYTIMFFVIQFYLIKFYISLIKLIRTETPQIWAFIVEQFTHKQEVSNLNNNNNNNN